MEVHANGVGDFLVDSLSFKLKASAKYAIDRRSVISTQAGATLTRRTPGHIVFAMVLTGDI